MVKVKPAETVCLDPSKPIARQYEWEGLELAITVPDMSMSLTRMVLTGTVGTVGGGSGYTYPDLGDEDEAHDHPDYERLNKSDILEKEAFANLFIQNPKNYEPKKELSNAADAQGKDAIKGDQGSGAPE